jgi:hypothetical protein
MEPSFWCICCTKNWPKWIKGEKIIAFQNRGVFLEKQIEHISHSLFPTPSKNP